MEDAMFLMANETYYVDFECTAVDDEYECIKDVEVEGFYSDDVRFPIISLATLLALFGCCANLLLFYIFVWRPTAVEGAKYAHSNLYLAVLALLDFLLCVVYVLLFGIKNVAAYLRWETIFLFIWSYKILVFAVSRMIQLAIPYILVAATTERFIWVTGWRGRLKCLVTPCMRKTVATLIVTIAIGVRLPLLMGAMRVCTTKCPNVFESKQVEKGDLMDEDWYSTYDLIVQIFQIFVSFAVLMVLNAFIVRKLKQARDDLRRRSVHASQISNGYDRLGGGSDNGFIAKQLKQISIMVHVTSGLKPNHLEQQLKLEKAQVRRAIRTMVVIITSYLACNSLHVCLYSLEVFWPDILWNGSAFHWYYVLCSDMVSILFMVSSAIRVFIYYKYNADTRNQIKDVLGWNKKRDRIRAQQLSCSVNMLRPVGDRHQIRTAVNGRLVPESDGATTKMVASLTAPETEELPL